MAAVTVHSILEPKKIKSVIVSIFSPYICYEVIRLNIMILVFLMLSFKPVFSLSYFTFIKRLFSSLISAIRVLSSTHLRLLIFLLAISIPACASSSPVFHMMYSSYKLNKQGDNIPWCTPFPIWNQSAVTYLILMLASCHAFRFVRRQVRSGIPISLRIFQFVLIHTVNDFSQWSRSSCFSRILLLFLYHRLIYYIYYILLIYVYIIYIYIYIYI